jgi:hypothetical protein
MKIIYRFLSILLVFMVLCSNVMIYAAEGDSSTGATDYATSLGRTLGEIYGARDFQKGEANKWSKAVPDRKEVTAMFDLEDQSSSYVRTFYSLFRSEFEKGYKDAYDKAMFEPDQTTLDQGVSDGGSIGSLLGQTNGVKDYYAGYDINFKRDLPSEKEIRDTYKLSNDYDEYEEGFIVGFITAYEESYNDAYRAANIQQASTTVTSEFVTIAGAAVGTQDGRFTVNIEPGTFYHDVNVIITTYIDAYKNQNKNFIKASDSYNVKLINSSGIADESKTIELTFEYYGDKIGGGIYRQQGSRWMYIPTTIKDNLLVAEISVNSLGSTGTTFSAFLDKDIKILRDARGHWASDEIEAYVRRGIISGYADNTFKPDNNISRAEFLTLLSRVYNWNTSWFGGSAASFKDAGTFGSYLNVINYATGQKYIYGYDDGTFKPGNPISYTEVETIMNRVLPNWSFRWANTANNMLYEKKVRSDSFDGMNNKITRAEVVYMLYKMTN